MFGRVSGHILAAGRQFEFNLMFGRVFGHSLDVGRQFDFFLMLGLVFHLWWFTISSRLTVIFVVVCSTFVYLFNHVLDVARWIYCYYYSCEICEAMNFPTVFLCSSHSFFSASYRSLVLNHVLTIIFIIIACLVLI